MYYIEFDTKKLQNLAIKIDKILREEIEKHGLIPEFAEARIFNVKVVGVQGDERTYGHPAEITLKNPKHSGGKKYNDKELYGFLELLSNRITNEVEDVNKVLYVLADRDDREKLFD